MKGGQATGFEHLSLDAMLQIDEACDAVEREWRSGQRPSIRDWANKVDEPLRPILVRELIRLEIAYRKHRNEALRAEDFSDVLPAADATWIHLSMIDGNQRDPTEQFSKTDSHQGLPPVLGDYILVRQIGSGGMGTVFEAVHDHMDRTVALKVLRKDMLRQRGANERFINEIRTIGRLSHPNIITAFDARVVNYVAFLVMEFVEGQDLYETVNRDGPLDVGLAIDCIRQAAQGLAYAHSKGIVHRDVKPANLMRRTDGILKLLDLGLAFAIAPEQSDEVDNEPLVGTVAFMPPEQASGSSKVDHRSDIYSLGCTMHFLLVGRPPYQASSVKRMIEAHRELLVPSLCEERQDCPPELDQLFQRMMSKQPSARCSSMYEVIDELNAIADKVASPFARNQTGPSQSQVAKERIQSNGAAQSDSRRKLTLIASVFVLTVVVLVFTFSSDFWRNGDDPNQSNRDSIRRDGLPAEVVLMDRQGNIEQDANSNAIVFDGESSFVKLPNLGPIRDRIVMEAVVWFTTRKGSYLIGWQHGNDYVGFGINNSGQWMVGRSTRQASDLPWTDMINGYSRAIIETQRLIHVVVVFDESGTECFVDGEKIELDISREGHSQTRRFGVILGGRPFDWLDRPDDNQFSLDGMIYAARIIRTTSSDSESETTESQELLNLDFNKGPSAFSEFQNADEQHNVVWAIGDG